MLPEEQSGLPDLLAEFVVEDDLLGKGSSGNVRGAVSRRTGQRVAVKTFGGAMRKPEVQAALRRECRIHQATKHPHIVQAEGVYSSGETMHLVMERLDGGDLFSRIVKAAGAGLAEEEAARVTIQLLRALGHLHARGICHRDIKPENVVYFEEGGQDVKLIDLGLAAECRPGERLRRNCGTLHYSAPEVLQQMGYDERADLWSLGALVYDMLVARRLYNGDDLLEVGWKARGGHVDYCRAFWSTSRPAQHFVQRLLTVNPEERLSVLEALGHPWLQRVAPEESEAALRELATFAALESRALHMALTRRGKRRADPGCLSFLPSSCCRLICPMWS